MSVAQTGAASRAQGKDDRSNRRAEEEGETRSAVSEPSSEQRVSVKAVKGAGKEKEDFLPAQALTVIPLKEFKACDGKKYAFPVGCKAKPKAMPELCITLDGRSL